MRHAVPLRTIVNRVERLEAELQQRGPRWDDLIAMLHEGRNRVARGEVIPERGMDSN